LKILITTTSFQDTPGKHHEVLKETGFNVDTLRGPVMEDILMPIIENYDGVICGDDYYTRNVLEKGKEGKLKVISKYGIGLDKIDLQAANECGIVVTNCPGVNHVTVAEHTFALMLDFYKNISEEIKYTRLGSWKRLIGHEIYGKKIGVAGLGRIGKEIILRAKAFGMEVFAFDKLIDEEFAEIHEVQICNSLEELVSQVDIVSLNMSLSKDNYHCINNNIISNHVKRGVLFVNTARGELVDEKAIIFGLEKNILSGYLTDVLENEPIEKNHPFTKYPNILITPHIGSRTHQSVERQGLMAVANLKKSLG